MGASSFGAVLGDLGESVLDYTGGDTLTRLLRVWNTVRSNQRSVGAASSM